MEYDITSRPSEVLLALIFLECFIFITFVGLSIAKRRVESMLIRIALYQLLKKLDKNEVENFCKSLNMVRKTKYVNAAIVSAEMTLLLIAMLENKSIKIIIPVLLLNLIDFILRLTKTRRRLLNYLTQKEVAQPVFSKEQNN